MQKMEKEGRITSMNIITKPIGKDTVKIIELNGRGH